jgi:hypothetical protein
MNEEIEQTDFPTAQGRSIFEVFSQSRSYEVPSFQRGYSWKSDEVDKILDDFQIGFAERNEENYLLGQTILCSVKGTKRLSVIDGQQRLTTLFLFLVSAKTILSKFEIRDEEQDTTLTLIKLAIRQTVGKVSEPRILVAENGRNLIHHLMQNESVKGWKSRNPSEENLVDAFTLISDFLNTNFSTQDELFEFVSYVCNRVYVLELRLTDQAQAIRVFLVMNNRGMTLADADLIKNLLFQKITDEKKFADISRSWNTAVETLFDCRLKRLQTMDFLLKALIGLETGETVSSTRIFDKWESRLGDFDQAWDFAQSLPAKAEVLKRLSHMKSPSNIELSNLIGSHSFRWTQHFEVLVAGSHLIPESFEELCKIVDSRVMLSQFSGEKNQDFERIVHKWANKICKAPVAATREELLELSSDVLGPVDILGHVKRLREKLGELTYSTSSHRSKLRYVLARCEMNLQNNYIKKTHSSVEEMMSNKTAKSGWHLDHVFPEGEVSNFYIDPLKTQLSAKDVINLLGNLILLSPDDNISQGKALPSDDRKQKNIAGSLVYLNATLVNSSLWGPNLTANSKTRLGLLKVQRDEVLLDGEWNLEAIRKREELYFELFAEDLLRDLGIAFDDLILD